MAAYLIKSTNKAFDQIIVKLAEMIDAPIKKLNDEEELDALLINSIEKGMKSGKASKSIVKKIFSKHGVRIH